MIFIDIEFLIIPDYEMISICFKTNLLFFSFKKILQTLVVTVKFFFFLSSYLFYDTKLFE